MTRLALALTLAATPALADRMTLHPGSGACFQWLHVHNARGMYNATETLDSQHGPVSVRYDTTPCTSATDPACADRATVVSLPDGVAAVPDQIDVMETDTGLICLSLFIGG
jgi:hypothetical protein